MAQNIIAQSSNLDKKAAFKMMKNNETGKLSEREGQILNVFAYCKFEDIKEDGKAVEILAIETDEGEIVATNSANFIQGFDDIIEAFGEENWNHNIKVSGGTSKSGRHYIVCDLVD